MIIVHTSIIDHINNTLDRAREGGRNIDYVVLTEPEVNELNMELPSGNKITYSKEGIMGTLFGVTLCGIGYHTNKLKKKSEILI